MYRIAVLVPLRYLDLWILWINGTVVRLPFFNTGCRDASSEPCIFRSTEICNLVNLFIMKVTYYFKTVMSFSLQISFLTFKQSFIVPPPSSLRL